MRRLLLYPILPIMAWLIASCSEPNSSNNYNDIVQQAIEIMDANGIYAEGNTWSHRKQDAFEAQVSSESEAKEIISKALRTAGGEKSMLLDTDQSMSENSNQQTMPTATPTDNGVWVITLPTFNGTKEQGTDYALSVLDALPDNMMGLILDLRQTQGEDPYPMLAAVHRFLPAGTVLNVRSRQGNTAISVETILAQAGVIEEKTHINCPVAILTSANTRGAGEAVLLSFSSLKNVAQIGQETAGYSSLYQTFQLSNGWSLRLATANYMTTSGREYGYKPIEPDIMSSTPMQMAKDWMRQSVHSEEYFKEYVAIAVSYMDMYGLLAEGSAWETARAEALAANPQSLDEARTIIRQALKAAGGKHSQLWTPAQRETIINNYYQVLPSVESTPEGIVVVNLPGCMGASQKYLQYTHTVLNALPAKVPAVIIDLRENNGGSMYPMLAAVHQFLPNGTLLTFRSRDGDNVVTTTEVLYYIGISAYGRFDCPVAILTSQKTASAGEATLLAFRGLANTRTFGTETAGYASGNVTFTLDDGSYMILTHGRDVARTGEVFCDDPIAPDVSSTNPMEDAIKWLQQLIK